MSIAVKSCTLIETPERHFRDVPDIYVSGNLMFYYEEGNPAAVVSPDVFVVKGCAKGCGAPTNCGKKASLPAL